MENNFYSTEKLVEFGVGMGIATQMANSMNQAIKQMAILGAGKPNEAASSDIYYVVIDNEVKGPYNISDIAKLISEKKICKETYVWKPGMKQWELAENFSEVLQLVALTPPPIPR